MEDMRTLRKEQCMIEELGNVEAAFEIYKCLLERCIKTKSLEDGRNIHAHIIKTHLEIDALVGSTLVNMYIKCGSMDDAGGAFVALGPQSVITWNAMIAGYCHNGLSEHAIHYFWKLKEEGLLPNDVTYLNTFKACATLKSFMQGSQVHAEMIKNGMELNDFMANTLIDMYAMCGSLADAWQTFKGMRMHTVTSYNVMISGLAQHGHFDEVFNMFRQMIMEGFKPDDYTLVIILRTCVDAEALLLGKHVHDYIIRSASQAGVYVGNTLITLYAKCGSLQDAYRVFTRMSERDLISWNTMIGGFLANKQNKEALELFQRLKCEGVKPDRATFISSLKACVGMSALDIGKKIHGCFIEDENSQCILLLSTLVDMYAKCNSIEDARKVFDRMPHRNVVMWNVVIAGYSHNRTEAFRLFRQMQKDGLEPDEVTFLNILKACNNQDDFKHCQLIHNFCVELGCEPDLYIGSTLVDVYASCGSLEDAWRVFEAMPERNTVSWNAMVGGCADKGQAEDALELFKQMEVEGLQSDEITYVSVFNACALLADLEQGNCIHGRLLFSSKLPNIFVGNALVDMYGKSGNLTEALKAFDNMLERDVVSWNALISGYAQHGHGKEALQFAESMQREGIQFNNITFVSILMACSYTGLVDEARNRFDSMHQAHGVVPTPEHYACMVDVYGRAGLLGEAVKFIEQMPIEPTSVVWMALLGACRTYGSTELASRAAEQILLTEPENSAAFLLVSSLYAGGKTKPSEENIGRHGCQEGVRM